MLEDKYLRMDESYLIKVLSLMFIVMFPLPLFAKTVDVDAKVIEMLRLSISSQFQASHIQLKSNVSINSKVVFLDGKKKSNVQYSPGKIIISIPSGIDSIAINVSWPKTISLSSVNGDQADLENFYLYSGDKRSSENRSLLLINEKYYELSVDGDLYFHISVCNCFYHGKVEIFVNH